MTCYSYANDSAPVWWRDENSWSNSCNQSLQRLLAGGGEFLPTLSPVRINRWLILWFCCGRVGSDPFVTEWQLTKTSLAEGFYPQGHAVASPRLHDQHGSMWRTIHYWTPSYGVTFCFVHVLFRLRIKFWKNFGHEGFTHISEQDKFAAFCPLRYLPLLTHPITYPVR